MARVLGYVRCLAGAPSSFGAMDVLSTLLQLSGDRTNMPSHSLVALRNAIVIIITVYFVSSLAVTVALGQALHPIIVFSIVGLNLNFTRSRYVLVALLLTDRRRPTSPLLRACPFTLDMVSTLRSRYISTRRTTAVITYRVVRVLHHVRNLDLVIAAVRVYNRIELSLALHYHILLRSVRR